MSVLGLSVQRDVSLAPLTTLRCGGPARAYVEASTDVALTEAVATCDEAGEPVLVLGRGSNLVIADSGFPGTVVRVATRGVDLEMGDGHVHVTAAAGEPWDLVVARCVGEGFVGIEALSGIPGTVGAAPVQNVGAYGAELGAVVSVVRAFDRRRAVMRDLDADECGFAYRDSRFKQEPGRWLVMSVTMDLVRDGQGAVVQYEDLARRLRVNVGDTVSPADLRRAVLEVRREKGMVLDISDHDSWSVGSFFVNPVVPQALACRLPDETPRWPVGGDEVKLSAAWLIENSGCPKGWALGPDAAAAISTKHALALINRGNATTSDILELARAIVGAVRQRFDIELVLEPTLVGCQL